MNLSEMTIMTGKTSVFLVIKTGRRTKYKVSNPRDNAIRADNSSYTPGETTIELLRSENLERSIAAAELVPDRFEGSFVCDVVVIMIAADNSETSQILYRDHEIDTVRLRHFILPKLRCLPSSNTCNNKAAILLLL